MTLDCLLIADDLTGACDAAVPFAMRGRRTRAAISISREAPAGEVVAISTDSRGLDAAQLRLLMVEAAPRLPVDRARILFKKIDSLLRGNPGAEIAAALEAFGLGAAVVTPAFPALGRTVEAGWLRVTAFDFEPVEVAARLREQGAEPCVHVGSNQVAETLRAGARFVSVDAASDADLDRIADGGLAWGDRVLWAGSAGLAAALARTLPARVAAPAPGPRDGPVLFANGSDHPVTLEHLERLATSRPQHRVVRVPLAPVEPPALPLGLGGGLEGSFCREILQARPAALVLSGGDTASLVCRALGACSIEVHHEILPGIPSGVLLGGALDGTAVATKSGAFGKPDALIQIADFFTCRKP